MKEILLVSDTELDPQIELLKSELAHYSYSLSLPVSITKTMELLRQQPYAQILVNASENKLEALDLLSSIRDFYKGAIKVFVYLPNSSASEGSKYGQLGAEVEDELSLLRMVDKLPQAAKRSYLLDENVTAVYGMHGGSGASLLSILLSYALGKRGIGSLLMETSPAATSIRDTLVLETKPALLTRDRNRELDQNKDSDWFSGFVSRSHFLRETHYLHLFASMPDRDSFLLRASAFSSRIGAQLKSIGDKAGYYQSDDLANSLRISRSNLELLSQELSGNSYSLFDEILQPGAQLAKNFIIDIGTDISSSINRQILKFTKNLIFIMRDNATSNLRDSFMQQKKYLEDVYDLNIIPVLAPGHHRYADYQRFSALEWQSLLGLEPNVFPYQPDDVTRFLLDHDELMDRSSLMTFVNLILDRTEMGDISLERKGLMDFLVRNS